MSVKVSFIMSVYNGEAYLEETLESILAQTYCDWECIVIDDCSTDGTGEILAHYAKMDRRVKVYRNDSNLRLPASLNKALDLAEGEYVARMDADDICRKDRLEKQVAFMEAHPELALSSCKVMGLMPEEIIPTTMQRCSGSELVEALFLFFEPINHPGVIARKKDMKALRYDPYYSCTEDLELWTRMIRSGRKLTIQDDYLLMYRVHPNQITATSNAKQREQYREIIQDFYRDMMFELDKEELDFLEKGIYFRDYQDVQRFLAFMRKVLRVNKSRGNFTQKAVTYAAFEVVMAYRGEFGLGGKQLLKALCAFKLPFVVCEFLRRKKAYKKSFEDAGTAAELFGLTLKSSALESGIPIYIRR